MHFTTRYLVDEPNSPSMLDERWHVLWNGTLSSAPKQKFHCSLTSTIVVFWHFNENVRYSSGSFTRAIAWSSKVRSWSNTSFYIPTLVWLLFCGSIPLHSYLWLQFSTVWFWLVCLLCAILISLKCPIWTEWSFKSIYLVLSTAFATSAIASAQDVLWGWVISLELHSSLWRIQTLCLDDIPVCLWMWLYLFSH